MSIRKAFTDGIIKAAKADKGLAGASISVRFASRVHELFPELVTKQLQSTGKVSIPSFGVFTVTCVVDLLAKMQHPRAKFLCS